MITVIAQIEKIAADSIPVIERDSGQMLNERLRTVIKHWLIRGMVDVRTALLAQQKAEATALLRRIENEMAMVR